MNDDSMTAPDNSTETDDSTETDGGQSPAPADTENTRQRMVRYTQWAAFAFLVLVALLATVRLYFAASATIDTFVTRRFRPLFMTGFNLAVLLGCGIGFSVLLRRMT